MISLLKKPKVNITITISDGPFYLGSTINTEIDISSMDSFSVRFGNVELTCSEIYWQIVSTGKSTYHQKRKHNLYKVVEPFLGGTDFTMGQSMVKSLNFKLPEELPPTASGKTVQISWKLKASLDVVKMRDINEQRQIAVIPIASAVPVLEKNYRSLPHKIEASSNEGEIIISLSSDSGIAGQTLRGNLEANMKKTVNVKGVRAELELKESAGSKSSKTTAGLEILEEQTSLLGGSYRKWLFELKIPNAPLPTVSTEKSSAVWLVKGVLDKRLRGDFSVVYPIVVF